MYWYQESIEKNIYRFFLSASGKVCKTSKPYTTLASITFPERFSGKNSVSTVLNSMTACSDSALDLCEILTCIGKGMTYADNKSYKKLLKRFEATQQNLREIRTAAVLYKQSGEYPTHDKIDQFLTSNLSYDGYGNGWGYTPEGKITAAENFNDFLNFAPELLTGAASGALVFGSDAVGGIMGSFLGAIGDLEGQQKLLNDLDYEGRIATAAKSSGYNPNSLMYLLGKMGGQIGAGILTASVITSSAVGAGLISPNSIAAFQKGRAMTTVYAAAYSSQSFASSYRNTEKNLRQNNTGLTENDILKKSNMSAGAHALTTFATTILTGAVFGAFSPKGSNIYGPYQLVLNTGIHTLGGFGHQIIDNFSGTRKGYSAPEGFASAVLAAAATGISLAGSGQGAGGGYTSSITPTSVLLQETVKSESNAVVKTSVLNTLMENPVTGNVIDDSKGGSHSFTIPVLEKIIEIVSTGATCTLRKKIIP